MFWILLAVASKEPELSFAEAGAFASARALLGAFGHPGVGAVSDIVGRSTIVLTGCLARLGLVFCLCGLGLAHVPGTVQAGPPCESLSSAPRPAVRDHIIEPPACLVPRDGATCPSADNEV